MMCGAQDIACLVANGMGGSAMVGCDLRQSVRDGIERLSAGHKYLLPPLFDSFPFLLLYPAFRLISCSSPPHFSRDVFSKMARRSPAGGTASRRDGNPFRTLIDLQDALQTKSVYILDGSDAPGVSNGILAQDVPVPPVASAAPASARRARRGASGRAASAAPSSHSSSTTNGTTAHQSLSSSSAAAAAIGPIAEAANLAGGRGYTAEAWEPTRQSMVAEQHALATRLRAVLEDALERDVEENGAKEEEKQDGQAGQQKQQPQPTILQRHAHTVLQLLGVTEAIHGGYVLEDYAAPYLSRLARRQHGHAVEMDGAAQVLRDHRAALAKEAAGESGAGSPVEMEVEVDDDEEEEEKEEEIVPPRQRHRTRYSDSAVSSTSSSRERVTANQYAKTYLTSHRSSGKASRPSTAVGAGGRYKTKGRTKKTASAAKKRRKVSKPIGLKRERKHLEKTAEWDSILRQARQQEKQDQHEKQEHLLEILRHQAVEAEAKAQAQAKAQAKADAMSDSASLKRPAEEMQGSGAQMASSDSKRTAPAVPSDVDRPLESMGSDDKDDLPIMHVHKARKASDKYPFLPHFVDRGEMFAAKQVAASSTDTPTAKALPQHDLFAQSKSRDDSASKQIPEPTRKQALPSAGVSAEASATDAVFKAPTVPPPPPSPRARSLRGPQKKAMKCHHCRNTTNQYRRCSYWKINGTQCRFVYCQTCLEDMYDHASLSGVWEQCTSDNEWHCPSCLNKCQCKPCATKREREEQRMMKIASSGFGDRGRRSRRGGGPSDFAHMF